MLTYDEFKQAVDDGYITRDTVAIVRKNGQIFDYVLPHEEIRDWEVVTMERAEDVLREIIPELKNLAKETSNLITTNDELKEQAKETKDILQIAKQEVADVRDTKSSIYTDFIAILGVFSAFVFVMFGGIDIARAIFDIGNDLQTLDLSRMITISSLMLIGVLTLMYSLLLWVARITGKNFGNCYSSKCDNGCQHKWRHFLMRHSFYFSLMGLLIVVILFSHSCV